MKSEDLVHLNPNTLDPHPTIKELEEAGIFAYSPGELQRLTESVREDGFLQPILVTPDGNGGYYRIAGKMRQEAAKALNCSVPAYVRQFPENDSKAILSAAKAENFKRRLWDASRVVKEEQAIEKFLSQRSRKRIVNIRKLHPDLMELSKKGVLRHRADENLVEDLKNLSMESQESLAEAFKEVINTKLEKGDKEKTREKLDDAVQKYKKLDDKYREDTERLQAEIERLEARLKEDKEIDPDSPVIESWRKQVKDLKQQLFEKEADLNKLRSDLSEACSTNNRPSEDLLNGRAKLILDATDKLFSDIDSGLKSFMQHLDRTIDELPKDTLIVSNDKLGKLWKLVEAQKQKITATIMKRLETIDQKDKAA